MSKSTVQWIEHNPRYEQEYLRLEDKILEVKAKIQKLDEMKARKLAGVKSEPNEMPTIKKEETFS